MEEITKTNTELLHEAQSEMIRLSSELQSTDYIALKELDGEDVAKYGDYKAYRRKLRVKYNELEIECERLQLLVPWGL